MAMKEKNLNSIKNIPSVHSLLEHFHGKSEIEWEFLKKIVQESISKIKEEVLSGNLVIEKGNDKMPVVVKNAVMKSIKKSEAYSLRRVINATGIILHTGLGRAPLSELARKNWNIITEDYCNLEFDLKTGERGERLEHINNLLKLLTGAEAGIVVNNNAAAVLLLLNTFGKDKNVILSRGELVEIGGSFRMPEVMEISGAKLKEIGATNRTHLKDYKNAIDGETSMILKVHPSNFRISGFSKEVEVQDLKNITEINNILLCYDLGGGALFDLSEVNLPKEPVVAELINQKIDLITFSGDKLIGGPQCGIIVGKKELIEKMHKNPMYRALRVDKNTIALLEATLRTFINKDITGNELYRKNNRSLKELKTIGNSLLKGLKTTSGGKEYFKIVESPVQIGSGALPVEDIPSIAIRFDIPNLSVEKIAKHFRELSIPVVGYIQDNSYFWNLKTLRKKDCSYLRDSLINLVGTIREKK